MKSWFVFPSPVGFLRLEEENGGIVSLSWRGPPARTPYSSAQQDANLWLEDYFQGHYRPIDFPLRSEGTEFQMQVWQLLVQVPPGEVTSYGDVAKALGTAPRAVGAACRANPLPIIVPCHRVVAANGSLGGYSGGKGLETKRKLLQLESALD